MWWKRGAAIRLWPSLQLQQRPLFDKDSLLYLITFQRGSKRPKSWSWNLRVDDEGSLEQPWHRDLQRERRRRWWWSLKLGTVLQIELPAPECPTRLKEHELWNGTLRTFFKSESLCRSSRPQQSLYICRATCPCHTCLKDPLHDLWKVFRWQVCCPSFCSVSILIGFVVPVIQ